MHASSHSSAEPSAPRFAVDGEAMARPVLWQQIDALLPQQQCGRCGYVDCAAYAQALAAQQATPVRCAPGGEALAQQLAAMSGVPALDAVFVDEGKQCARIDEEACIGCTRCLRACPLDALIGASKRLHAVLTPWCSGCGLCVLTCPIDCITLVPVERDWTGDDANAARTRYQARQMRKHAMPVAQRPVQSLPLHGATLVEAKATTPDQRQQAVAQALEAARARRAQHRAVSQKTEGTT